MFLNNRPFALLWFASIVTNLSLAMAMLAETWFAVNTLKLESELGWVMLAGSLPRVILMVLGGVLADRFRRAPIMAGSMLGRALILAALALTIHYGVLDLTGLIAIAALYGVLDAVFWPARDALLPTLLEAEQLTRANAILLTTNQIGMVAGPALGGMLLAVLSLPQLFALCTVLALVGAIACVLITEKAAVQRVRQKLITALSEGFTCVRDNPVLRTLLAIYAVANLLFSGPMGFAAPLLAANLPGGSAGLLGQLQSAYALGMVTGGVLLGLRPVRSQRLRLILYLITVEGLLLALLPQLQATGATIVMFLLGFCIACNNVPMIALLQQFTPPENMGRVMSLNNVASLGLTPIAYAATSMLLAAGASLGWIAAVLGLLLSALCLIVLRMSAAVRQGD